MNRSLLSFGVLAVIPGAFLAFSDAAGAQTRFKFQYSAKFVCGTNLTESLRILPGDYATAVNIHNPDGSRTARLRKKIALTFPPAEQSPGAVSEFIFEALGPDQAFGVDCEEIPFEFFPDVETGFPPYVKGILVVESDLSLDVIAVYTAGDLMSTGVGSIDVEDVRERRINQRRDDRDDDSSSDDDSSDDDSSGGN